MRPYESVPTEINSDLYHDGETKTQGQSHTKWQNFANSRAGLAIQIYIAVILTIVCILQLRTMSLSDSRPKVAAIGNDGELLELQYSRDLRYMSLSHHYDHLWKYDNGSTFQIPDPELDTGKPVDAMISMFHQLHCLSSFRTALQNAREGGPVALDQRGDPHWPHCLDYLRNTLLCFADGTLELPKIVNGSRVNFIDGAQDLRRCRSTKALFSQKELFV